MDTKTLLDLKEKIITNKINPTNVGNLLYEKRSKSWHSKEWKEKRNELLKKSCEQCDVSAGIRVIQHMWHPRRYNQIKNQFIEKYKDVWVNEHPIDEIIPDTEVFNFYQQMNKINADVCPICFSTNVSERKTKTPKYRCNYCKQELHETINQDIPILMDDRAMNAKSKPLKGSGVMLFSDIKTRLYEETCKKVFYEEYIDLIERETIVEAIDENLRYMSLADTVTFCKKCAFLWDERGMNLCPCCKKEYKYKQQAVCKKCKE